MSKAGTAAKSVFILPVAAIVTVGIFLVMSGLIAGEPTIEDKEPPEIRDFVMPDRTETTPLPEPVSPVDLPDDPPAEPIVTIDPVPGPDRRPPPPPDRTPTTPDSTGTFDLGLSGAIITPAPMYPPKCVSRGIEGSVTVQFDVTANGGVTNARVINSSDSCFDRAALDAISKWKFQPQGGSGTRIVSTGLRKKFVFQLGE